MPRETIFETCARLARKNELFLRSLVGNPGKYALPPQVGPRDTRPFQLPPTDVAVLRVLVPHDTTRTEKEIRDDLERDHHRVVRKTLARVLARLVAGGQVKRVDGGGYRLTAVGREYVRQWPEVPAQS